MLQAHFPDISHSADASVRCCHPEPLRGVAAMCAVGVVFKLTGYNIQWGPGDAVPH